MYASSVAAYGFHRDNPQPLTEEVPARGTAAHYYSAQKAEVEALLADTLAGGRTAGYVFRPCIVAGPQAPLLIDSLPYTQISERLPAPVLEPARRGADPQAGAARPRRALPAGPPRRCRQRDARGRARPRAPGVYNLAGAGELTVKLLAEELGWYSIPVPELAVDAVAEMVGRLGFLPAQAQWIAAFREPVIMSASKARRELRLAPAPRRPADAARDDQPPPDGSPHPLAGRACART